MLYSLKLLSFFCDHLCEGSLVRILHDDAKSPTVVLIVVAVALDDVLVVEAHQGVHLFQCILYPHDFPRVKLFHCTHLLRGIVDCSCLLVNLSKGSLSKQGGAIIQIQLGSSIGKCINTSAGHNDANVQQSQLYVPNTGHASAENSFAQADR